MEVLSGVVSGVVTKLVEYAVAPVGRQVGYVIQYNSNLKNLMTKVQILKERRQRITDVNKLTKEVDEVTREVDTFLGSEGHAKAKCFHGFSPNPILYYQLSKKAKKLVQKIEPFENAKFPPPEICSVPSQDYLAFDSRISVVKEIMKELRNPDTNKIGVWGVGGVGKTTLAKEVYRQANEEKLFDGFVIIVDVKNYSGPERIPTEKYTERIQKEIAEKLDIDVRECLTEKGRARHLWDNLKEKKILVILDDVWQRIEMEEVGIPPTCKLLFTSRSRDRLFSGMGIQKDFGLDTLGEEESWSLFEKMAGGVVRDEPIREKAILVSKKCEGLPILVVTVARALRNSSTLYEWNNALRQLKKLDMENLEEKPLLTLEWSYNQLDDEDLKSMFLLCAILASFMRDNFIHLEYCFIYSMGLGLLKKVDTMEEARDAFHSLIKKLQNHCLLQEHVGVKFVRMHELLCNVAISIARRDKHALLSAHEEKLKAWPKKEFLRKCTMICIVQSKMPQLPQVPWECRELKFLCLDFRHDSVALPGNLFEDMKKLKVLDLSEHPNLSLPPSLRFLTDLQTLCLEMCVLEDIALVGQLTNLDILRLNGSKIKQLPEEIGQLTRLRLLDLTGCSELVLIPPNVLSSLESLEDLRMAKRSFRRWEAEGNVGSKRTNASLSELTQLSKLTALEIHIRYASVLPSGLFLHLERYHVLIGEAWEWDEFDKSFNTLKLKLATSKQLDRGLEMLVKKSEHLYLDVMEGVSDIFHELNSDQQLKHLHVENSGELTYLINHNVFQKLQSLTLKNLPKLVTLSSEGGRAGVTTQTDEQFQNEIGCPSQIFDNGEGIELVAPAISFKNLTTLEVIGCQRLEYLLISSISQRLMQLTSLVVRDCKSLTEIVGSSSEDEAGKEIAFNRLKHLELSGLPSLQCFFLGNCISQTTVSSQNEERKSVATVVPCFLFNEKVGFPSLETLIIKDLPQLFTIWHEQLAPDSFCKLRTVDVQGCQSLINIFGAGIMGRLNALVSLKLTQCNSLQLVFEQEGFTAKERDDASITLEYCPNLGSVNIEFCQILRNIFPASVAKGLPQFRELRLYQCDRVEEIVAMEGVGMTSPTFVFPNATYVKFENLPQLASFYPGVHTSVWPLLEVLSVMACDYVKIFAMEFPRFQAQPELDLVGKRPLFLIQKGSFYNLKSLWVGKMKNWWSLLPAESFSKLKTLGCQSGVFQSGFLQKLPHLEDLELRGDEKEVFVHQGNSSGEIHAVATLPQLKSLSLSMFELMDLGKENYPPVIPNLEILRVNFCGKLKNLKSSAISYQNLQTLEVTDCYELEYLITCSMVQSLTQLTSLEVENCRGLMEIVANSNHEDDAVKEIAFMKLETLKLSGLQSLQSFCSGNCIVKLPSLGTLTVTDCLIELKISPDKILLSDSNPERLKLIEEEAKDHDKPEGSGTT